MFFIIPLLLTVNEVGTGRDGVNYHVPSISSGLSSGLLCLNHELETRQTDDEETDGFKSHFDDPGIKSREFNCFTMTFAGMRGDYV